MNSLQQVMSQITSVCWQESEKLIDASNFSIRALLLNTEGIKTIKFRNGAMLNDVLYAPAGANLISISAATNRGGSFNFAGDDVLLNGT